MKIKRFVCNAIAENCYVVSEGGSCVIIDPGFDGPDELAGLYSYLDSEALTPTAILLTHTHFDHVLGVPALVGRFGIPVYPDRLAAAEVPEGVYSGEHFPCEPEKLPSGTQAKDEAEEEKLPSGLCEGMDFKVIRTPGHTPDSICFYSEKEAVLFTGDTLFAGTIGRTDLPGGDYDSEIRSIMEKLIFLPGETAIYPGHGPASTIARERMSNPFLEPFNEREEMDFQSV